MLKFAINLINIIFIKFLVYICYVLVIKLAHKQNTLTDGT